MERLKETEYVLDTGEKGNDNRKCELLALECSKLMSIRCVLLLDPLIERY